MIETNSLQLRVITIGLYQFLSRSPSCQILAVCGRRLRGVSGSWFPRFLSPAAFLDSDRRRLVCPLLPCATRLSPYGKLRFCLRKAPRLPTEAPPLCLRKAPFSFSLRITSCNKLSFSATESSRLHCDRNKIADMYQSGKGHKALPKASGLQRNTARAINHKWRKLGTVANLPRGGRPTKITPRAP